MISLLVRFKLWSWLIPFAKPHSKAAEELIPEPTGRLLLNMQSNPTILFGEISFM